MTSDGIQKQFTRQELAEALGLSEEKIDVFEGMGLISERSGSEGAKSYNSFDHARLRLIARCETAGYALDEIREMLGKVNSSAHLAQQLQASLTHAQEKIEQIEQRINQGGLLETVNLRCDQDLLQGYINDIKSIRSDLTPEPREAAEARTAKKFTLAAAPSAPAFPPAAAERPRARLRTGEFVRHTKPRVSNMRAWKQTAATFLILSLLTAAGYLYFNYKSGLQTAMPMAQQEEHALTPQPPEQRADALKPTEPEKDIQPPPSPSVSKPEPTRPPVVVPKPPVPSPAAEGKASTSLPQSALKDLDRMLNEKRPSQSVQPAKSPAAQPQMAASDKPVKSPAAPRPQMAVSDKPAKSPAVRPQIAAYEFKAFYEKEKKILRVKFKMASIVSEGEINQGHAFVVFKPRQSAPAEGWLCIPSSQLASGVPLEPENGEAFSFSGSKVQYLKGLFEGDPKRFDIATVFIFSNTNELVLRKEFAVDMVAY